MTHDITSVCVGGSILGQYVYSKASPLSVSGKHILFVSLYRNIERLNWQSNFKMNMTLSYVWGKASQGHRACIIYWSIKAY